MAEIMEADSGHGKKKGKRRPKKHPAHIDMTPMVDLMCLLITFFMLTTAFSKPKVMEIVLPAKEKTKDNDKTKIPKSRVVNIILGSNNKIFWYNGLIEDPKHPPVLEATDYSKDGIRKILLRRNKDLFKKIEDYNVKITKNTTKIIPKDSIDKQIKKMKSDDDLGPIVLIKAGDGVKYGNIVDLVDEMAICNIARYAIVDLNKPEKKMLNAALGIPEPEEPKKGKHK